MPENASALELSADLLLSIYIYVYIYTYMYVDMNIYGNANALCPAHG